MGTAVAPPPARFETKVIGGMEITRSPVVCPITGHPSFHYRHFRPIVQVTVGGLNVVTDQPDVAVAVATRQVRPPGSTGNNPAWFHDQTAGQEWDAIGSHGHMAEWSFRRPTPIRDALAGLHKVAPAYADSVAASPEYAAKLAAEEKAAAKGSGLFVVPTARVSPGVYRRLGINPESLKGMLDRHTAGDFGSVGSIADVELSDEMRFCPYRFSELVQDAAAIESGWGLVKSRYPVKVEGNQDPEIVKIATLLVPGQELRTAVTSSRG